MKKTMIIMLAAFCGLMNTRAGDLTTDGLTVNSNAVFYGQVDFVKLSSPPTNGLLLYYGYPTNATPIQDQSGNGYTGTAVGATWVSTGRVEGAYFFNGSVGNYKYIKTSLTNLAGSEISITYWFKGSALSSAVRQQADGVGNYVIAGWTGGGAAQHILSNDGGTTGGLSVDGNGGATVNNGSWHHVAMTWKQNTANGFVSYLDGVAITSRLSTNVAIGNYATAVEFGRYQGGGDENMVGTQDEVRIYSRVLTSNEVYSLYVATGRPTNGGVVAANSIAVSNAISQTSASGTNIFMGKVGIGTTNPSVQLDVAGDVAVSGNITLPGGATGTLCYLKCDYIYDWAGATLGIDNHSFRLMSAGVPTVQWDAGILSCKDWRVDNTATGGQEIVNYETMTNYLSSTFITNNPSDIPMGTYTNQ